MRARVALALIVGVGTWVLTAACELLLPTSLLEPRPASPPCGALPPADPHGPTSGTGEILAAVRTFEFQRSDGTLGYNLDKTCTCQEGGLPDSGFSTFGPPSCRPPFPGVAGNPQVSCDALEGRDIGGVTGLSSYFQAAFAGSTGSGDGGGTFDQQIEDGLVSFLFRVRNLPDGDGSGVVVELFNASGLFRELPDAQADGSPYVPQRPQWDGNDSWALNCGANGSPCSSPYPIPDPAHLPSVYNDHTAYVRDGQLVAHFPSVKLDFRITDIVISNVVLVATVTDEPTGRGLKGQLAGRLPLHEFYKSLSAVAVGGSKNQQFLCGNSPAFIQVRQSICAALDLRADPKTDNTDQLCDALGIAFGFSASPAQFGSHVEHAEYPRACPEDPNDDCTKTTL